MSETASQITDQPFRILIADDHPAVVEGVIRAFEKEPDFKVVGAAADGAEALEKVETLAPDIVILDISMPNMKGIDATHEIKTRHEDVRVLIYTMYSDTEYVTTLFRLGVSGYVLKRDPISDLVQAVEVIANGGAYFSKVVQEKIRSQFDNLTLKGHPEVREQKNGIAKLTVREKEVFLLLADGLTPKTIAKRLAISPKTVETHKYNIMEKLDVATPAGLTKIAYKKNLLSD